MAVEALGAADPPWVRGLPVVGSLPELTRDPVAFFTRCYRRHGPVFRVRLPGRSFTVIAGPDVAAFMGSAQGRAALSTHEVWHGLDREYGAGRSLLSSDGETHRRLRAVQRRGYSRQAMTGRLDDLVRVVDDCVETEWRPGTSVRVMPALTTVVVSQLGTILTGRVPVEHIGDIRTAIRFALNVHVIGLWPRFVLRGRVFRRARDRVLALADDMAAERSRGCPAARDAAGANLIDDVLSAHRAEPGLIARGDLALALTGPYVAGMDTVANTLGSLVHLLLSHPDALARVRAEADAVFGTGAPLAEDVLDRMPATRGAVLEAMRLYPIAAAQPRTATSAFTFAGHRIPAGETVYCAATVTHFLPEYFPSPEVFDVDRYGPDRREHAAPGAYSPFGRGPHTCLGKGIAEVQMVLTVARLVHRLDLDLDPPGAAMPRRSLPTPGPRDAFAVRVRGVRRPAGTVAGSPG